MQRVVLGLLGLFLASGVAQAAPPRFVGKLAPPADIATLTPPDGKLALFGAGDKSAAFVDVDSQNGDGKSGHLVTLRIFEPGIPTAGVSAVEIVQHEEFDCVGQRHRVAGAQAFTESGVLAIWLPVDEWRPTTPGTGYEVMAKLACDGAALPDGPVVTGHAAALKLGREQIAKARGG